MNGKSKCKLLKEIRKQIAAENDIAYVTSECKHQGDCTGTCPKCEAEVRYLEQQLSLRRKAGKAVAVAGVAAALMVTASGCKPAATVDPVTGGDPLPPSGYEEQVDGQIVAPTELLGDIVIPGETDPTEQEFMGVPVLEETEPTEQELMGEPMPEPTE